MTTASLALQRAAIAALSSDTDLMGIATGVFAAVPPDAGLPYVTVGPDMVTDWSTKSVEGREHRLRLSAWDEPLSVARCATMLGIIERVVLDLATDLGGHRVVSLRFLRSMIAADPRQGPVQGMIEFRARTHVA